MYNLIHPKIRLSALASTVAYGFTRKVVHVHNATYTSYNDTGVATKVPMLLPTKVALVVVSAFSSVYLWHAFMYIDACSLEIRCRNLSPEDYHITLEPSDYGTPSSLIIT